MKCGKITSITIWDVNFKGNYEWWCQKDERKKGFNMILTLTEWKVEKKKINKIKRIKSLKTSQNDTK